ADAADIADADADEGLAEAVVAEILAHAEVGRHLEMAAELAGAVKQAGLIDAAGTQFGTDAPVNGQTLRQKVQAPAGLALFQVALAGLGVGFPVAQGLAVRHYQQRAGDFLAVAGAAGNVFQHAVTQALTFLDHAVDHDQRDHQQNDKNADDAEPDQQIAVHGVTLRRWVRAESLYDACGGAVWEMWRLCGIRMAAAVTCAI